MNRILWVKRSKKIRKRDTKRKQKKSCTGKKEENWAKKNRKSKIKRI